MKKIVIDIETVPREGIMDTWYAEWAGNKNPDAAPEELEYSAGLYPEFGRVCCVCLKEYGTDDVLGRVARNLNDERDLLYWLGSYLDQPGVSLIGHNIKGFDIPFLAKRYLAHSLPLPSALKLAGKKPWEITHQDTMELLRFGNFSNMSLRSACLLLGLDDPKENDSGKSVWDKFRAGDLESIQTYCEGDVNSTEAVYSAIEQCGGV